VEGKEIAIHGQFDEVELEVRDAGDAVFIARIGAEALHEGAGR
jgi:hypothetical protein